MPTDTNPAGDIFGGWLMSQMDIAGGVACAVRAKGRVATIAVDGFNFYRPVHVGDVVSCYVEILKVGKTSINARVEAWATESTAGIDLIKVTEGIFTFVALNNDGTKREVSR